MKNKRKHIYAKVIEIKDRRENSGYIVDYKMIDRAENNVRNKPGHTWSCFEYEIDEELHYLSGDRWDVELRDDFGKLRPYKYDTWYEYIVVLEYLINNITYTREIELKSSHDISIGDDIGISYEINNPQEIEVSSRTNCLMFFAGVGILVMVLVIYAVIAALLDIY